MPTNRWNKLFLAVAVLMMVVLGSTPIAGTSAEAEALTKHLAAIYQVDKLALYGDVSEILDQFMLGRIVQITLPWSLVIWLLILRTISSKAE